MDLSPTIVPGIPKGVSSLAMGSSEKHLKSHQYAQNFQEEQVSDKVEVTRLRVLWESSWLAHSLPCIPSAQLPHIRKVKKVTVEGRGGAAAKEGEKNEKRKSEKLTGSKVQDTIRCLPQHQAPIPGPKAHPSLQHQWAWKWGSSLVVFLCYYVTTNLHTFLSLSFEFKFSCQSVKATILKSLWTYPLILHSFLLTSGHVPVTNFVLKEDAQEKRSKMLMRKEASLCRHPQGTHHFCSHHLPYTYAAALCIT